MLKELLALVPVPEETLSLNEIMGFMFGVAMTPMAIPQEEWMSVIFGDDHSPIPARDQARSMSTILGQVFTIFMARQQQGKLDFPYQLETLEKEGLEEVLEWVSGFEEALALRPDLWEPSDDLGLTPKQQEEVFFSMMVIQGLIDPMEVMPFFEKLPDEIFSEAFKPLAGGPENRELQIQAFLFATLPLSIQTLQAHAKRMRKKIPRKDQPGLDSLFNPPVFSEGAKYAKGRVRGDNIIRVDFARKKKITSRPADVTVYQLKVNVLKAKPPIWRRILVPGWVTLAELHEIIQVSMGWLDEHLHHFDINDQMYGPILEDDWGTPAIIDETRVTLDRLALSEGSTVGYTYDYGDNWQHSIKIELISPKPEEGDHIPRVIKGKRACPPENIGGIWGYQEFLEAYTDPSHDDHAMMVEWAGPDFRPELFDKEIMEEVNRTLAVIFPYPA